MKLMTSMLRRLILAACLIGLAWSVLANYSFVFSKKIKGEVIEVERMTQANAIIGGAPLTAEQLFSFAVMIKTFDGKIFSASSEDRQWAVAKKGYCVEARLFPYPPWNLEKDGTYFNARLVGVFDCKSEAPAGWTPGLPVIAPESARLPGPPTSEPHPAGSPGGLPSGSSAGGSAGGSPVGAPGGLQVESTPHPAP